MRLLILIFIIVPGILLSSTNLWQNTPIRCPGIQQTETNSGVLSPTVFTLWSTEEAWIRISKPKDREQYLPEETRITTIKKPNVVQIGESWTITFDK